MRIIAFSEEDTAGSNIGRMLIESRIEKEDVRILRKKESILMLREEELKEELKNLNINSDINSDTISEIKIIIVASKHRSKSKIPTLTVHSPGNFGSADFGGEEKKLSICPAKYIRKALIELKKEKEKRNLNYEVSLEVTHHGPTINIPIIFVEVGSCEEQWNDLNACGAAAETIKKLVTEDIEETEVAVGFGGTHYAPNFTRLVLEKQISFGHIMPKYCEFEKEMIAEMIKKTTPKPSIGVLDWHGLRSAQRNIAIDALKENGLKYKRTTEI